MSGFRVVGLDLNCVCVGSPCLLQRLPPITTTTAIFQVRDANISWTVQMFFPLFPSLLVFVQPSFLRLIFQSRFFTALFIAAAEGRWTIGAERCDKHRTAILPVMAPMQRQGRGLYLRPPLHWAFPPKNRGQSKRDTTNGVRMRPDAKMSCVWF